jgi:2-polyprenyl-6-hydroxyphenyl methylase/3-demethylubiquinone-9 3-methyltransferase
MKADTLHELRMPQGDSTFIEGPREIHAHIARPVILQLGAAGAYQVLDLGCGNGWFTAALERCGFQVTGVDASVAMLEQARLSHPSLQLLTQDINAPLRPELRRRYDAVVAIDVIDHLTQPRRLVETALQALKPGGLLVMTSPYHGYMKNLALALAGRFDRRWDALTDDSRIKFFSRGTLLALLGEYTVHSVHFETIGRVPMFARAMLVSARVPAP